MISYHPAAGHPSEKPNVPCATLYSSVASNFLYSSAFSSTSSVSPRMFLITLTASPSFSKAWALMVSTRLGVASSEVGASVAAAAGASLVTMVSGLATPSMPMSSVSKTASSTPRQYGTAPSGTERSS